MGRDALYHLCVRARACVNDVCVCAFFCQGDGIHRGSLLYLFVARFVLLFFAFSIEVCFDIDKPVGRQHDYEYYYWFCCFCIKRTLFEILKIGRGTRSQHGLYN